MNFLAMLSHELRNPLAPLCNALYLLKTQARDSSIGDVHAMMERQLQQLVRLVDDLLDVSRIIRGKIDLRKGRIDLAHAVHRAAETAKPVIDAHGHVLNLCTVSVWSPGEGQGSEFRIRLPALPDTLQEDVEGAAGTAAHAGAARRVLVVDDNIDAAESIARILRLFGHDVRCAYDGPAALHAASEYKPEVVVLDIGLPGMDGYQVASELRARKELGAMQIVAVTGYGQEEDRRQSREAGFDRHLTKPVDPEVLRSLVGAAAVRP